MRDLTTELDDRFLSSGYRYDLLGDRLYDLNHSLSGGSIGGPYAPKRDYVGTMRDMAQTRTWLDDSFTRMRIEYPNTNSVWHYTAVQYLSAFYKEVRVERATLTSITVVVEVAPIDSAWLALMASSRTSA